MRAKPAPSQIAARAASAAQVSRKPWTQAAAARPPTKGNHHAPETRNLPLITREASLRLVRGEGDDIAALRRSVAAFRDHLTETLRDRYDIELLGVYVYPAQVESAIYGHPAVAEVAVIGVPSAKWGEEVKACVVAKPGHDIDEADVIAWARERIAAFKAPKSVDVIPLMPRNASGKILRRELRAPYWEGQERQVS